MLLYHDAHHFSDHLHAHHDQRAGPSDRRRHRLVVTDGLRRTGVRTHGLAGYSLPAGRHLRRRGHQLLAVLRGRRAGRAVPDRQGRHRGRASTSTRSTATSGTPICPPSPRASATASGCTGRGIPRPGHRCDPSKLLLDPYGKSFHGDFDFTQALFSYDLERRRPRRPAAPRRCRLAGPHHDQRGDQPVLRLGVRPRAAHAVPRDRHLRGARQGHDADPSRHPRGAARHLRRAGATRRSSTTSSR